jgi:tetratricopeptide (TPR) repeat protein
MEHERAVPERGNTTPTDSSLPLIFDGFDFSISEEELRETVLAWSEYIGRLEQEKLPDERTKQLLIMARMRRGLAWSVLGETAQAIQEFQWLLKAATNPQDVRAARLLLGNAYAEAWQDDLAIEQWSATLAELEQASACEAKKLPADLPRLYLYRGLLHARQQRYREAVTDCDRALRSFPDWAEAHSVKGLALAYLGDLDAGLLHCTRAVALEPGARSFHRRGVVYRMRQLETEALADFWRAWKLDPTDAQIRLDFWHMLLGGSTSLLTSLPLPENDPAVFGSQETASSTGGQDEGQGSPAPGEAASQASPALFSSPEKEGA